MKRLELEVRVGKNKWVETLRGVKIGDRANKMNIINARQSRNRPIVNSRCGKKEECQKFELLPLPQLKSIVTILLPLIILQPVPIVSGILLGHIDFM